MRTIATNVKLFLTTENFNAAFKMLNLPEHNLFANTAILTKFGNINNCSKSNELFTKLQTNYEPSNFLKELLNGHSKENKELGLLKEAIKDTHFVGSKAELYLKDDEKLYQLEITGEQSFVANFTKPDIAPKVLSEEGIVCMGGNIANIKKINHALWQNTSIIQGLSATELRQFETNLFKLAPASNWQTRITETEAIPTTTINK